MKLKEMPKANAAKDALWAALGEEIANSFKQQQRNEEERKRMLVEVAEKFARKQARAARRLLREEKKKDWVEANRFKTSETVKGTRVKEPALPYEHPEINEEYRNLLVQIAIEEERYRERLLLQELEKSKLERNLEQERLLRAARGRILGKLGAVAPLETPKPKKDFYLDIAGFKSTFEHSMKLMMPKLEYYYGPY